MKRPGDPRTTRGLPFRFVGDGGFSIIEVLVALTLLAVVTAGIVPLLVSGLRASLSSKYQTEAKNLAQERLEIMRNLPFYVSSSSSSPPPESCWKLPNRTDPLNATPPHCDYKDLLDTYYRSAVQLAGAPPASPALPPSGYVDNNSKRSADEIAENLVAPYYRLVLDPVPGFQGRFTQVILSQFLNDSRQVVIPSVTYNTQDPNLDSPPSRLLGVTVMTRWKVGTSFRKNVIFSQIAEGVVEPTSVSLAAEATAIRVGSALDLDTQIELESGISRSRGTLAGTAAASTFAQGGYAAFTPSNNPADRKDGKYSAESAPPTSTTSGGSAAGVALATSSLPALTVATIEANNTSNATAGIVLQQPSAPTTNPGVNFSEGSVSKGLTDEMTFTNRGVPTLLDPNPLPDVGTNPLIWLKAVAAAEKAATGRTYITSQTTSGHFAQSGSSATGSLLQIFQTPWAPQGVVQVELLSARVTCKTTGTSTAGSGWDYSAIVRYRNKDTAGYIEHTIVNGVATPPLPADLNIPVSLTPPRTLSQYIQNLSALGGASGTESAGKDSVSLNLDGIVRITTQPSRNRAGLPIVDETSTINVAMGVLSCLAEDKRK